MKTTLETASRAAPRRLSTTPASRPRSNDPLTFAICSSLTPKPESQSVRSPIRAANWSWYSGSRVANRAAEIPIESARLSTIR